MIRSEDCTLPAAEGVITTESVTPELGASVNAPVGFTAKGSGSVPT